MPYIGNIPADKFLTLAKQSFSTSATTSYTLDSAVSSTQDIALFINNVRQSPVDAYSVSGTSLTLTSATAGTDEMYCVYLGKTVGTVSPASDSVTTAMIQANAVTGAKLNTDVISAQTSLGATPADTDELLVSDAGVLKRVDYSHIKGLGKIGQVLSDTKTDTASTTSSTFAAISGLSIDITPSATSSKILVLAQLSLGNDSTTTHIRLSRGSTSIFQSDSASNRTQQTWGYNASSQYNMSPSPVMYLDSPSSTSSLTYSFYWATQSGTAYINRTSADRDNAGYDARGTSSITVMEVLA